MAWELLKNKIYQICNAKNRKSGETTNRGFETYKSSVIPHGKRSVLLTSTEYFFFKFLKKIKKIGDYVDLAND